MSAHTFTCATWAALKTQAEQLEQREPNVPRTARREGILSSQWNSSLFSEEWLGQCKEQVQTLIQVQKRKLKPFLSPLHVLVLPTHKFSTFTTEAPQTISRHREEVPKHEHIHRRNTVRCASRHLAALLVRRPLAAEHRMHQPFKAFCSVSKQLTRCWCPPEFITTRFSLVREKRNSFLCLTQ